MKEMGNLNSLLESRQIISDLMMCEYGNSYYRNLGLELEVSW
jgi:hypothetical protein